jgi:hypothetical protein
MSNLETYFIEHNYIFEELRKNNLIIYTYRNNLSYNEKIYIEFKNKYTNKIYKTVNEFSIESYNNLKSYYPSSNKIIIDYILRMLGMIDIEIIQDIQKTNRIFIFDNELPLKIWMNCLKELQKM